jgi:transposase
MAQNFIRPDRDQPFLMPPDMREWLPEDDLAWVVLDAVEQCDLSAFTGAYRGDGQGRPAFDPAMMVALLLHSYCCGVRSSREIERRCVRDVAFRVIAGGLRPDHATIARFRARHEAALQTLFTEILRLCAQAGMVRLALLAIDGTKVGANASWSANRTLEQLEADLADATAGMLAEAAATDAAEDEQFCDQRGDELPEPLRTRSGRLARLTEARDRLAARAAGPCRCATGQGGCLAGPQGRSEPSAWARAQTVRAGARGQHEQRLGVAGEHHRPAGPHRAVEEHDDRRLQRASRRHPRSGHRRRHREAERSRLHPAARRPGHHPLPAPRRQLRAAGIAPRLRTVVADSGYLSEAVFAKAHTDNIRLLAPLSKDTRLMRDGGDPAAGQNLDRRPETARGQRRLRHHRGRADYKQRGRTVEPVFGQLKTRQHITRFSRRGITAVISDWHLAAAAHNLLKLQRHQQN